MLVHLGDLYKNKGDFKIADEYYLSALNLDHHNANTLYKYASFKGEYNLCDDHQLIDSFLAFTKEIELAESYYKRAISLDPRHINCMQEYAGTHKN